MCAGSLTWLTRHPQLQKTKGLRNGRNRLPAAWTATPFDAIFTTFKLLDRFGRILL